MTEHVHPLTYAVQKGDGDAISRNDSVEQADSIFAMQSSPYQSKNTWQEKILKNIEEVNKELWLILSMFVLVGIMNYLVTSQRIMLGLYTIPTLMSAYFYGRRHATLTALASILLVGLVAYFKPTLLTDQNVSNVMKSKWYELGAWGCILIVTAYAMGTLYDQNSKKLNELRQTYHGIILILRHFISKDKYTENHCYRVSIYASTLAAHLKMKDEQIEDIRSAGLLHDLGKLDISRDILYKAAQLTREEYQSMKKHVDKGVQMMTSMSTPLGRVLPIVLAHHERYDGSGYYQKEGDSIPIESRILAVADVYDALTSDRPYRKAMSPFEAKGIIEKGAGTEFDPVVVKAFIKAFKSGDMDIPNVIV